ncbi:hypothetical protein SEA_JACKO_103 [Microbacterium phage Jacko]|nr:hypothetical protein SEA_JACKO_103 [Microbacterium phage Jacko]
MNIAEIVKLHGIRKGDLIRITDVRELRVEQVLPNASRIEGWVKRNGGGVDAYVSLPLGTPLNLKSRECELIERPMPDLPTEPGSVVRYTASASGDIRTWMLANSGLWRSSVAEQPPIPTDSLAKQIAALANGQFQVV